MGSIALFGPIHGSHCTILVNFYLYIPYFRQKVFSFSKTNRSQTDSKCTFDKDYFCYYLWVSLHFLVLFMGPTILFQLTFTYSIQQKNFSFNKINGSQTECENYCVHSIIQIIIQVFDMITP